VGKRTWVTYARNMAVSVAPSPVTTASNTWHDSAPRIVTLHPKFSVQHHEPALYVVPDRSACSHAAASIRVWRPARFLIGSNSPLQRCNRNNFSTNDRLTPKNSATSS
jgi:hypothetical protein